MPLIYRVHDEPDIERVNALREFLKTLDISLPKAGALRSEQFNHILQRVKGHEAEKLVNEVVLRTQAQAEYAAENYGHFGLNLRRYAHFTSPIRRYADLVVHRGLIRAGKLGDGGLPETEDLRSLTEISAAISATERRAMKAERETFDRLLAHFLADRVGATFQGHISGVTRAGLFVKLDDTGADGLIPARTIGTEYFRYEEHRHALIGNNSGETYRLGDAVTVKLVEAAPVAGALRFELLSEGRYDGRKPAAAATPQERRPRPWRQAPRPEKAPMMQSFDHVPSRDAWSAMLRGWRGRCPNCGEGRMFRAFLKISRLLPGLRRSLPSPAHRRRAGLFRDPDRRPHRRADRVRGRGRIRAVLLGPCRALAAVDDRHVACPPASRSRAHSSACNGRCGCTASIRRRPSDELAPSRIIEPRR